MKFCESSPPEAAQPSKKVAFGPQNVAFPFTTKIDDECMTHAVFCSPAELVRFFKTHLETDDVQWNPSDNCLNFTGGNTGDLNLPVNVDVMVVGEVGPMLSTRVANSSFPTKLQGTYPNGAPANNTSPFFGYRPASHNPGGTSSHHDMLPGHSYHVSFDLEFDDDVETWQQELGNWFTFYQQHKWTDAADTFRSPNVAFRIMDNDTSMPNSPHFAFEVRRSDEFIQTPQNIDTIIHRWHHNQIKNSSIHHFEIIQKVSTLDIDAATGAHIPNDDGSIVVFHDGVEVCRWCNIMNWQGNNLTSFFGEKVSKGPEWSYYASSSFTPSVDATLTYRNMQIKRYNPW